MCNLEAKIQKGPLSHYVADLCLKTQYSDVTFCIAGERFPAHKLILASREYFRALLFGHYAEKQQNEIQLKVQAAPFKALLKYIYNDGIFLGEMEVSEILEILRLAHEYDFTDLSNAIKCHLEREISMETVFSILEVSKHLSFESLSGKCLLFLDANASILVHDNFSTLSQVNCKNHIS